MRYETWTWKNVPSGNISINFKSSDLLSREFLFVRSSMENCFHLNRHVFQNIFVSVLRSLSGEMERNGRRLYSGARYWSRNFALLRVMLRLIKWVKFTVPRFSQTVENESRFRFVKKKEKIWNAYATTKILLKLNSPNRNETVSFYVV